MLIGAPKDKRSLSGKTLGGSIYKCAADTQDPGCELLTSIDRKYNEHAIRIAWEVKGTLN